MKKLSFLVVLFLYGLSVGNLFAATPAAGYLGQELINATQEGNKAEVKRLLDERADVNATDMFGFTALMYATLEGNADIVGLLLDKGAELNATNPLGYTALMSAAIHGHQNVVEKLLKAGADKTIPSQDGNTAEKLARIYKHNLLADYIQSHKSGGLTKSAWKR